MNVEEVKQAVPSLSQDIRLG